MTDFDLNKLKFNDQGLIVAITQDTKTKAVLMQAWMNKESIIETLNSGFATYFSRSRNSLWKKGETSGNLQKLVSITADCDLDSILLEVEQSGKGACHTGKYSCFFNQI